MKTIHFPDFGDVLITLPDFGNAFAVDQDQVHHIFTEGYCASLAAALNHITGCKIVITDLHAAVMTFFNGQIQVLDIEGVHDPDYFEEKWGAFHSCSVRTE